MGKTLLVLGASLEHVELLRWLRAAGCRVITADRATDAPAHARSDLAVYCDDEQSLLAVMQKEGVSAVLAPFSNADTPRAARLCNKLQLPSISDETAEILASRNRFREFLTEMAQPHPQTHVITRDTELPQSILEAHKWVLRPDRSTGRGPALIRSAEGARAAIERALCDADVALLERYVEGQHTLCSVAVADGKIAHAWFLDRAMGEDLQTLGLRMPSKQPHHMRKQASQVLSDVIASLKIKNAVLLAELVTAENKVYLLDLAPRLPGHGGMELIRQSAGVDLAGIAGALACGEAPGQIPDRPEKAWGVLSLAPWAAGRLDFDPAVAEKLSGENWVRGLSWFVPRGTLIEPQSPWVTEAGRVYIAGRDRDAVDARAVEFAKRLEIKAI